MSAALILAAPGAFAPAVRALAGRFAALSGTPVATLFGPAGGESPDSVTGRLQSASPPDLVLLPAALVDRQIAAGTLVAAGRVEAALSPIALCVRAGAPRPDVSTPEALRQTLLAARSIGISALASGTYFRDRLLGQLGLAETLGPRCHVIIERPVAQAVAQGAVELGVQQRAELLQEDGIDLLDPLPEDLQGATLLCAAASPAGAIRPPVADFLRFLTGAEAAACLGAHGLLPAPSLERARPSV